MKKSKLLLRILAGWLGIASLLLALAAFAKGGPGLLAGGPHAVADLLAGRASGSEYFRQQTVRLFYDAALLAAGGESAAGGRLTASQNGQLLNQAAAEIKNSPAAASGGDVLYAVEPTAEVGLVHTNTSFRLCEGGRVAAPLGYEVALAWSGGQLWGSRALIDAYRQFLAQQAVLPDSESLGQSVVVLAVREPLAGSSAFSARVHGELTRRQPLLALMLALGALAAVCGALCLALRRQAAPARALAAGLLGRVWLEWKLLALAAFCLAVRALGQAYPSWFPLALPALAWPLVWLAAVDLAHHRRGVLANSFAGRLARLARGGWRGQPWQRRVLAPLLLCGLLAVLLPPVSWLLLAKGAAGYTFFFAAHGLAALAALAALAGFLAFFADCARVMGGLHALRLGQGGQPPRLAAASPLAGAAGDLAALKEGVDAAVERQRQADKTKMELLTNVSHDLKTPLTSILNYSDLLCAEPLEGPAADYALIIRRKAERLGRMVQDVFDLSKAASGSLPVDLAPIDLAKLLRQTLAEMDEAISASPLTFKVELAPEAWVLADGDRLYRVFQNLFSNALQYSLAGSRVYVSLACQNGRALAAVKNVAGYEMDFDPARITERFVRGEASRTGEGSGLGLSIAKSFAEACGGTLTVSTDADLFCAAVSLPLVEKPAPPAGAVETDEPAGAGEAAETAEIGEAAGAPAL